MTKLLAPLEALLEKAAQLMGGWEEKPVKPAQKAISERDAIRREIARYKVEQGLVWSETSLDQERCRLCRLCRLSEKVVCQMFPPVRLTQVAFSEAINVLAESSQRLTGFLLRRDDFDLMNLLSCQ
ncbi:MAG: hypothetical protein H8E47_03600 [Anaerolineales bacterium]|nr:hypothetical protein [Anaerolineales bacterium]